MNEQRKEVKSRSRREFLRGATVTAGGVALIGADLAASAQEARSETARPARRDPAVVRASAQSPTWSKRLAARSRQRRRRTRDRPRRAVRSTPFVHPRRPKST
jgi:hypothetical protein